MTYFKFLNSIFFPILTQIGSFLRRDDLDRAQSVFKVRSSYVNSVAVDIGTDLKSGVGDFFVSDASIDPAVET